MKNCKHCSHIIISNSFCPIGRHFIGKDSKEDTSKASNCPGYKTKFQNELDRYREGVLSNR